MSGLQQFAPLTPTEIAASPIFRGPGTRAAPIMPIPREAGECDLRFDGRKPDEKYWFRDTAGAVLFGEMQWRAHGCDKQVRPCVYTRDGWRAEAPPPPRVLFNLDKLAGAPDAPVILFEGPRKAKKAASCFRGAVCSAFAGGANAAKQIDFSPLRGRDVTLCRDADEAGARWQSATIVELQTAGVASIRFVDPTRLPAHIRERVPENKRYKLDVVDLIEAGIPSEAIGEAAESACVSVPISAGAGPTPLAAPVAPATPYPVDALGDVLAGAARAIAAKVQCANAMAAQSVLAVASLAAQALADVRLPYGQTRPLSLYCLTIAASGDRKSSADLEAMVPVRMREKQLREAYEPLVKDYAVARAAWHGQRQQLERCKSDLDKRRFELEALGPEPDAPIRPILTLGESTAEGLAKHMPTLPGALGIFSPEGGQFLSGHGFSSDAKLRTAASFASLWDGQGLRRLRAGDGLIDLHGRRLACHLMIQPEAAGGVPRRSCPQGPGIAQPVLDRVAREHGGRPPMAGAARENRVGPQTIYRQAVIDL